MSENKAILDDAELAKSYIANSTLSNEYKRVYLKLINVSTLATNGITPEEKIQKMTECIQMLAVTQGMYLANIDHKIEKAIEKANTRQCENCKAMKHVDEVEREEHDKELLNSYIEKLGLPQQAEQHAQSDKDMSWTDIVKEILLKPYIYVVAGLMVVSPYGVDIVKMLCQFFSK